MKNVLLLFVIFSFAFGSFATTGTNIANCEPYWSTVYRCSRTHYFVRLSSNPVAFLMVETKLFRCRITGDVVIDSQYGLSVGDALY